MGPKSFLIPVLTVWIGLSGPAFSATTPSDNPSGPSSESSELRFYMGYQAFQKGELNRARSLLRQALKEDTGNERARYWLGKTLYSKGYNDSAVRTWSGGDTVSDLRPWFRREIQAHRLRYRDTGTFVPLKWKYVGLVRGERFGRERNVNPSALEKAAGGGWFSASYRSGRVLHYTAGGDVRRIWSGFHRPVDLRYVSGEGLYVVEFERDRIQLIPDSGPVRTYTNRGLAGPQRLLFGSSGRYVFNFGTGNVVRLNPDGDTLAVVYQATAKRSLRDVALGPEGRLWILDGEQDEILVVGPHGARLRTIEYDPLLDFTHLWWFHGTLIASGAEGLKKLDPRTGKPDSFLDQRGDLPGEDVSDLTFMGDRMILSTFENSEILLYRMDSRLAQDLIVQVRRTQFADFPLIRTNLILEDPMEAQRFHGLSDGNFRVVVDKAPVSTSFLRSTRSIYGFRWLMLIDGEIEPRERWREIRPMLERLINQAPEGSRGRIRKLGASGSVSSFTTRKIQLRNRLYSLVVPTERDVSRGSINRSLHRVMDRVFGFWSPTVVFVVSPAIHEGNGRFTRLANRLRNNHVPLVILNPTVQNLSRSHPLIQRGRAGFYNLKGLEANQVWRTIRQRIRAHKTAVFQETLQYQKSSEWRPFEFAFHYLDRIRRYEGAYLLP